MMKRLAALLLLAALAFTFVSGDADARKRRNRNPHTVGVSKVTIDFEDREPAFFIPLPLIEDDPDDYFTGTITPVRGCEGRHTVTVERAGDGVVGTTQVSSDGSWIVYVEDPEDGDYFAKAAGVTVKGRKACSRGTSPIITVENSDLF